MRSRESTIWRTATLATSIALWALLAGALPAAAQLSITGQFDPSASADNCGLGFDSGANEVWVYGCSNASVHRYSTTGTLLGTLPRPGESANDVDVEVGSRAFTLGATPIAENSLLFINGESGVADVYALDKSTGTILATLNTAFGASHVVGGAYHRIRQTLFLVQDLVAGATNGNRVAELDPTTGAILNTFQIGATFSVNFGDLEVCNATGNLIVVSSNEARIAEYSPTGTFLQSQPLPSGVSNLSGIGIDETTGDLWVGSSSSGLVWRLAGGPCSPAPVPTLAAPAVGLLAALLLLGSLVASRRLAAPRVARRVRPELSRARR